MKILFLQMFPLVGSGSGTYARELAREVAKHHTTAMVAPDKRIIPGVKMYYVDLVEKFAFSGHPEWPTCKLYTHAPAEELTVSYLAYFHAVMKAVNDFKPNVIHVHHLMPYPWIARYIKMMYGINYIVTAHGSELPVLAQDRRYAVLTVEALQKASAVVPNSYWTKSWMHDVLGVSFQRRTKVIPGGVNISSFPDTMDTKDIDAKYKLTGKKLVLFSGKLTKYKGVKYLVQAAKTIKGTVGIAGDGPERKELEQLVKDLGLTNVVFFGHLNTNDLIKMYYRADVAVAPSIWDEPLGLVILEAMAAKTPVVVTRKGGIPLMVKEGINGLFVKAYDAADIAEKVNLLLEHETMAQKMGKKARQTVEAKFTWELIAHKYELLYQKFKKREIIKDGGPIEGWLKSFLQMK